MMFIDPREVPIIQVDNHLPTISAHLLTEIGLKSCFDMPPASYPNVSQEYNLMLGKSMTAAAVLLGMVTHERLQEHVQVEAARGEEDSSELFVLLTLRNSNMRDHAGQISLPGGKVDGIDKTLVATALRETHEELGIPPQQVDVWGALHSYKTFSAFEITPVVGLVNLAQPLKPALSEVSATYVVPLAFLMNPANHRWHTYDHNAKDGSVITRHWLSMEYIEQGQSCFIWGITAAILRNLYLYLRACETSF